MKRSFLQSIVMILNGTNQEALGFKRLVAIQGKGEGVLVNGGEVPPELIMKIVFFQTLIKEAREKVPDDQSVQAAEEALNESQGVVREPGDSISSARAYMKERESVAEAAERQKMIHTLIFELVSEAFPQATRTREQEFFVDLDGGLYSRQIWEMDHS